MSRDSDYFEEQQLRELDAKADAEDQAIEREAEVALDSAIHRAEAAEAQLAAAREALVRAADALGEAARWVEREDGNAKTVAALRVKGADHA